MADTLVYSPLWKYQVGVNGPSLWTYLKFTPVTPFMQQHISKVHFTMALGFGLNSLATYLQLRYPVYPPAAWFGVWASFLLLLFTKPSATNEDFRATLLLITSFSKGLLISSFYHPVLGFDVSALESFILGATAIFLSFSIASSLTARRKLMFLGAALLASLSTPFAVALSTAEFGKSKYEAQVFSGLVFLAWHLGLETQFMVERSLSAGVDPVWDALWVIFDVYFFPFRLMQIAVNTISKPSTSPEADKKSTEAKGKGKGKSKKQ